MSHENITAREGCIFTHQPSMKESTKYWIYSWASIAALAGIIATCAYAIFR